MFEDNKINVKQAKKPIDYRYKSKRKFNEFKYKNIFSH